MGGSGRLRDEMRGVRVKCQVWKGCGWLPWSLRTHTLRGWEGILCSIFSLILSPQLLFSFSLHSSSLSHLVLPSQFFHPLHPNYWCHCKLNCCSRVVTFPLKSPNRYLSWWKWRLFPSANFQVCVIGGTEENAGWLPPLLRNVFTKGCEKLWSLDSRPCISNILLLCLSLWVLCKHFSPRFLFVFCFCCSGLNPSSRFILIFGSFFLLSCGIAGLFHFTSLSGKKTMADTQSETSRWTYRSIKELKERIF